MSPIIPVCICLTLAALLFAVRCQYREKRTLRQMNEMLDEAIRGDFSERDFDESLMSSVETKLAHYFSASTVSAKNMHEEKEKIKTLIADISHQTKTPLSNLLLYTQLLEEQDLSEEGKTCVAALNGQTKKLQALIEALVKLSRLETGIITLNPKKAPVQPVLEHLEAAFRPVASGKHITLHFEETNETAVFDPKWTEEAVGNLLDNAIKYTPEGGTVRVAVMSYELFCRIDVIDSGIGIPEGEQAKIFGRFYRSEAAWESDGVGIGLYLARQIASGQGGYIKVRSTPGKGSTFSIFLPRK